MGRNAWGDSFEDGIASMEWELGSRVVNDMLIENTEVIGEFAIENRIAQADHSEPVPAIVQDHGTWYSSSSDTGQLFAKYSGKMICTVDDHIGKVTGVSHSALGTKVIMELLCDENGTLAEGRVIEYVDEKEIETCWDEENGYGEVVTEENYDRKKKEIDDHFDDLAAQKLALQEGVH